MNTQGTPSYYSIKHTDIALYSKCPRFAYSSVGHDVNIAETQLVTTVCCHVRTAAVTAIIALTTYDERPPHHVLDLQQAVLGCTTADGEHNGEYWYIRRRSTLSILLTVEHVGRLLLRYSVVK